MADLHTTTFGTIPAPGRTVSLLTWTQSLIQTTLGPPFAQTDWPLPPRGAPYPLSLRTLHSLMTLVPGLTFVYKVRRMERTTAKTGRRADIARMEQTTTKSARRVDE